MDGRPTWTDCDEAGDYGVPNVLSPRDLVFRPDNMDETVPHTRLKVHLLSPVTDNDCSSCLSGRRKCDNMYQPPTTETCSIAFL